MSIRDYEKSVYNLNFNLFDFNEVEKIIKSVKKQLKSTDFSSLEINLSIKYIDRGS